MGGVLRGVWGGGLEMGGGLVWGLVDEGGQGGDRPRVIRDLGKGGAS